MTKIVLTEITDLQAETLNGGFKGDWQSFYFDKVNNLQINGRDGVQNNFFFNFGNKRHRK
jgi:hypothetical protein